MNDLIRFLPPDSRAALVAVLDLAFKATAILMMAWALHFLAGRRRALLRSSLWNTCLVGLLLLPVACLAFPPLRLPVLPTRANATTGLAGIRMPIDTEAISGHSDFRTDETFVRPAMLDRTEPTAIPGFETGFAKATEPQPVTNPLPTRGWRLDLVRAGIGLYLAVVMLLLLRLGASLLAIRRLGRSCIPVDEPAWADSLARASALLKIARRVRLLRSDRISVPIVVGWLRPAIVLPEALSGPADRGLIDAVLLHELAHIRRGDFIWNVVRRFVQALYWPHPLVWSLGRVIGAVREQACDDLCVHILGGPDAYHDSLVEVAAGLVRRPEPALGMAMARSSALARRIAWIHRTRGSSDCILARRERLALAVSMVSIAGLIGSVELARAAEKPAQQTQDSKTDNPASKEKTPPDSKADSKPVPQAISEVPKSIEITVLAKDTGKPLANASISAYVDRKMESLRTDAGGKAWIDLTGRSFLDMMSVDVWADGYVQQRHAISKAGDQVAAIPADLTVELWPGEETLGGKVVDEQGQPVFGAKVEIRGYLGEKKDPHELAYMVDCTTDAQGQWRCRSFRKMTLAYLYLSHPDFLADSEQTPRTHGRIRPNDPPSATEQPFQALRDFTDVEVMKKGIRVAGRVVDEAGKPVAGAEIGWIRVERHVSLQLDVQKATADADGRFVLPQARPGQIVLQFKAPGRATELKVVTAKEGLEPLKITLGRPYSMTGRVVDSKGGPIGRCEVLVDAWRGYGGPGFYLKTDSLGRFRWDEAPAEGVLLRLSREGFESISGYRVDPSAGEAIITLRQALQITGSIVDAATGQKIMEGAEVEVGTTDEEKHQILWKSGSSYSYEGGGIRVTAMDGQLRASLDAESEPRYRLRVRAKGYEPFESRDFRRDEGTVKFDFRLKKSDESKKVAVNGIVKRPDGKPLEGAEVIVAYDSYSIRDYLGVRIVDGKIQRLENQIIVKTDADGRFALTRVPDTEAKHFAVVVVHSDFYAEVPRADIETDPVIVARPWGRIEGVARLGTKLASGAKIHFFRNHFLSHGVAEIFIHGNTQTDGDGKFVIERVPPGEMRVNRTFQEGSNVNRWFATTLVKVKPGETARVELGGKGRPVIARIERPAGFDPALDYAANSEIVIRSDRPIVPYPKEILARRDESMGEWHDRWWNSPEGFEYRKNWLEFGSLGHGRDGTIRFEEVPPGDYELQLTYSGEPVTGRLIDPSQVGYATLKFTVPDIPGGYTDEPLDLGTLKPLPKPELKVGEAVPDFDVETLDGKRAKLADLRGKFVLLDFWATWCGPCVEEIPEMKAVFERHGINDKFAMVSLSIDAEKDAPRKFAAEKGLNWHQGWLGAEADEPVTKAWHVESIPAIFLIGPDGRLIAKGLRGREMAAAVVRALGGR